MNILQEMKRIQADSTKNEPMRLPAIVCSHVEAPLHTERDGGLYGHKCDGQNA